MPEPLPLFAFATPDGSRAGLALGDRFVATPDGPAEATAEVELGEDAATLRAGELTLRAALRRPAPGELGAGPLDGDGEAGAVAGAVPAPDRGESLRLATAVFPGARAFGLAARRPRRARGHDRDELAALVVEAEVPRPVEDPRLSVTLDGHGVPLRIGLELWLAIEPPEDEEAEAEPYEPPRRASGEVSDSPARFTVSGVSAEAYPVRWRSRGEDGFGWFVLVGGR